MPRRARVVIPQTPHHVTQRGNFQENVFENEKDFRTYLYLMDEYSQKNSLIVNAYCLMSNHVH
ncbi:MAG: transposase, partial [Candidatus Omnitrophica bacterium]|nr:transposase [Candidatus Omnitrophota bacterium]